MDTPLVAHADGVKNRFVLHFMAKAEWNGRRRRRARLPSRLSSGHSGRSGMALQPLPASAGTVGKDRRGGSGRRGMFDRLVFNKR